MAQQPSRAPRLGEAWAQVVWMNPNFYGIWLLSKIGLARKIRVAKFDPKDPRPAGL